MIGDTDQETRKEEDLT